jgi:hypothetical protein
MGQAHTFIAPNERGERNRLRRGKRSVPSGAMFNARDLLAILVFVGLLRLVLDELRAAFRVLSLALSGKVLAANGTA